MIAPHHASENRGIKVNYVNLLIEFNFSSHRKMNLRLILCITFLFIALVAARSIKKSEKRIRGR